MKEKTFNYNYCLQGGDSEQSGYGRQDDHLKVQSHMTGAAAGDGAWTEGVTTRTKTTTRKYTDSDGTLITEVSFPLKTASTVVPKHTLLCISFVRTPPLSRAPCCNAVIAFCLYVCLSVTRC